MKKVFGFLGAAALTFGVAAHSAYAEGDLTEIIIDNWAPTEFFSFGGPTSNPVEIVNFDPGTIVTGIQWDLTVTANDPAWLSEFGVAAMPVENVPDGGPGIIITPGAGDNFDGTATYSGGLKFDDNPDLDNFALPSGDLWLEGFDWASSFPGLKNISGSIWIQTEAAVPAPGALALLGLAGLVGVRRRRS